MNSEEQLIIAGSSRTLSIFQMYLLRLFLGKFFYVWINQLEYDKNKKFCK